MGLPRDERSAIYMGLPRASEASYTRATSSMVEQFPLKESVPGSNPGSLTIIFF